MSHLLKEINLRPITFANFLSSRERRPKPPPKRPIINYEKMVRANLEERGWTVYKTGWPDFFCVKEDGSCMILEAKGPIDHLTPNQKKMRTLFQKYLKKKVYVARSYENGYVKIL